MFSYYPTHIFRSHPKSFDDIGKHGDIAGDGCHSLLQQVKTRVKYKNRNNALAQESKRKKTAHGNGRRGQTGKRPFDQYGYVAIYM